MQRTEQARQAKETPKAEGEGRAEAGTHCQQAEQEQESELTLSHSTQALGITPRAFTFFVYAPA